MRDSLYPVAKFDIKEYIDKLLCIDAITRNEDRHFRNISFIFKGGSIHPQGFMIMEVRAFQIY